MSKHKTQLPDIDTAVIGPSCCGKFSASRELCNQCVAQGLYSHAICFALPNLHKGTDYEKLTETNGGSPP